jgi:hypothetical protein
LIAFETMEGARYSVFIKDNGDALLCG